LATDIVEDGIRKFVNYMDGPAFLERELMGLGVDEYLAFARFILKFILYI
jgi:hypothetical protein